MFPATDRTARTRARRATAAGTRPTSPERAPSSSLRAPAAAQGRTPYPKSIAATGDSLTRAAGTGILPWTDNPSGSWSTGTDTSVNSHYLRLLALNPKIRGHNYNDARSGAKMGELASQMGTVVSQGADYVTVDMGGNGVCAATESAMTSVADYRAQFRAGLERTIAHAGYGDTRAAPM